MCAHTCISTKRSSHGTISYGAALCLCPPPTHVSHDCYDLIPPEPSSQLPPREPPGQRRLVPTIIFSALNRVSCAHCHHVTSFTTKHAKLRLGPLKGRVIVYFKPKTHMKELEQLPSTNLLLLL
ncbi:hypothetical protein ABVT39_002924 [Epinephelus coioides]